MTEAQRTMYSAVATVRNVDVNLRWSISQLFFFIHSAGLSLVVTRLAPASLYYSLACAAGFGLGVVWFIGALRMQVLINYWNAKLGALEELDTQPILVFADDFVRVRPRLTTHRILLGLIGFFSLGWLIVLLITFLP